jgi:hypothetical protein
LVEKAKVRDLLKKTSNYNSDRAFEKAIRVCNGKNINRVLLTQIKIENK